MTQASRNISRHRRKSVTRRAALTGAAAKRLSPRAVQQLVNDIASGLERCHKLVETTWLQVGTLEPLIVQAVFRELLIEIRPRRDQANLILERNGGRP